MFALRGIQEQKPRQCDNEPSIGPMDSFHNAQHCTLNCFPLHPPLVQASTTSTPVATQVTAGFLLVPPLAAADAVLRPAKIPISLAAVSPMQAFAASAPPQPATAPALPACRHTHRQLRWQPAHFIDQLQPVGLQSRRAEAGADIQALCDADCRDRFGYPRRHPAPPRRQWQHHGDHTGALCS